MNNNHSEPFEVCITVLDSYGGHCVENATATYKNLDKEQVNEFINQVNNFNNGDEFDDSIMEDMFNNWYEENCEEFDSQDEAYDYFNDGAGFVNGWALDIDVFDSNGQLIDLEFDGDEYESIQ